MNTAPARYTITAALPYTNGPVHIGHLAGVYLPADIYARFLRMAGKSVLYVCGSDEHGVPITLKAAAEGVSPQQVVDKYHAIIRDSFRDFGISFDVYGRTSAAVHHETAAGFFKAMYQRGVFEEKTTEQWYDETAGRFLADRYIMGTCPHCHYEKAYGDQCENCGRSISPMELIAPHSMLSGAPPVLRPTSHWFLPLDRYQGALEDYILKGHPEWKPNVYGQCKSWLDGGLQPRAITRDLEWGVQVPLPGAEGKVLYVWFDAPIGYISATKEWATQARANGQHVEWEPWWTDSATKLVHFIGKDNIVFHCIIFPAILMAHGGYILADNVPANEFLNLEGQKISTSRDWAVWLPDYLLEFPGKQDELRYALCATLPETKDNDFTWTDYQARVNNELVAVLGNFVNRALVLVQKFFGGRVPTLGGLETPDRTLLAECEAAPARIGAAIEAYRFREALGFMMDVARAGNRYLAETEPWKLIKTDAGRASTVLHLALQVSAQLATLMEPFMPHTAPRLRTMLNLPAETPAWASASTLVQLHEGHTLGTSALLFEKVEDEAMEQQREKLRQSMARSLAAQAAASPVPQSAANPVPQSAANPVPQSDASPVPQSALPAMPLAPVPAAAAFTEGVVEPAKPEIHYDDFAKLDLRMARIIAAEAVPKTDKLLKLTLDAGEATPRTVVSGIALSFTPEEVVGQTVLLLCNLAPRKLRGIESQGMILMADTPEGKLRFVTAADVPAGSSVS